MSDIIEMVIDLSNYKSSGTIYKRVAVRGIARRGDKYLFVRSRLGDYKFPGGGAEEGESFADTLVREMREETGYEVIRGSEREYIVTYEKRKGKKEDILEMTSHYFLCELSEEAGETGLEEYEKELKLEAVWVELDKVEEEMEKILGSGEYAPWMIRELQVVRKIEKLSY